VESREKEREKRRRRREGEGGREGERPCFVQLSMVQAFWSLHVSFVHGSTPHPDIWSE
jgi:hypothetical protein